MFPHTGSASTPTDSRRTSSPSIMNLDDREDDWSAGSRSSSSTLPNIEPNMQAITALLPLPYHRDSFHQSELDQTVSAPRNDFNLGWMDHGAASLPSSFFGGSPVLTHTPQSDNIDYLLSQLRRSNENAERLERELEQAKARLEISPNVPSESSRALQSAVVRERYPPWVVDAHLPANIPTERRMEREERERCTADNNDYVTFLRAKYSGYKYITEQDWNAEPEKGLIDITFQSKRGRSNAMLGKNTAHRYLEKRSRKFGDDDNIMDGFDLTRARDTLHRLITDLHNFHLSTDTFSSLGDTLSSALVWVLEAEWPCLKRCLDHWKARLLIGKTYEGKMKVLKKAGSHVSSKKRKANPVDPSEYPITEKRARRNTAGVSRTFSTKDHDAPQHQRNDATVVPLNSQIYLPATRPESQSNGLLPTDQRDDFVSDSTTSGSISSLIPSVAKPKARAPAQNLDGRQLSTSPDSFSEAPCSDGNLSSRGIGPTSVEIQHPAPRRIIRRRDVMSELLHTPKPNVVSSSPPLIFENNGVKSLSLTATAATNDETFSATVKYYPDMKLFTPENLYGHVWVLLSDKGTRDEWKAAWKALPVEDQKRFRLVSGAFKELSPKLTAVPSVDNIKQELAKHGWKGEL